MSTYYVDVMDDKEPTRPRAYNTRQKAMEAAQRAVIGHKDTSARLFRGGKLIMNCWWRDNADVTLGESHLQYLEF